MVRVLVSPDIVTEVPLTEVNRAAKMLEDQMRYDPPRGAKRNWEHVLEWNGTRVALICKWKPRDDLVLITRARRLKGRQKLRRT